MPRAEALGEPSTTMISTSAKSTSRCPRQLHSVRRRNCSRKKVTMTTLTLRGMAFGSERGGRAERKVSLAIKTRPIRRLNLISAPFRHLLPRIDWWRHCSSFDLEQNDQQFITTQPAACAAESDHRRQH